ncbi:hypothetical protein HDV06_007053 [Boothiomyces sp. JEL0866]|nr:hypothetical protein HDV06_007053 [Boothiomyces sp. JEL0866]
MFCCPVCCRAYITGQKYQQHLKRQIKREQIQLNQPHLLLYHAYCDSKPNNRIAQDEDLMEYFNQTLSIDLTKYSKVEISNSGIQIDDTHIECSTDIPSTTIQQTKLIAKARIQTKEQVNSYPEIIKCKCSNLLYHQKSKILELPNEYWFELQECWACHDEDYTKLKGQEGGVIYSQKGVLMVGTSYYLVHPSDLKDEILIKILKQEERVMCKRCLFPLGKSIKKGKGIQLYKYRVNGFDNGINLAPSFTSCFLMELIDEANTMAHYRYLINDKLFVILLNWKIYSYKDGFKRAVKILYGEGIGEKVFIDDELLVEFYHQLQNGYVGEFNDLKTSIVFIE